MGKPSFQGAAQDPSHPKQFSIYKRLPGLSDCNGFCRNPSCGKDHVSLNLKDHTMPTVFAMPRALVSILALAAAAAAPAAAPASAQSAGNAQCDAVMMQGPQFFPAIVVDGCRAYFQALADGAAAPGTFPSPIVRSQAVIGSASDTGG